MISPIRFTCLILDIHTPSSRNISRYVNNCEFFTHGYLIYSSLARITYMDRPFNYKNLNKLQKPAIAIGRRCFLVVFSMVRTHAFLVENLQFKAGRITICSSHSSRLLSLNFAPNLRYNSGRKRLEGR